MKLNIQKFAVTKSTTFAEDNLDATNNTSTLKITINFSANNSATYFSGKTLKCTCNGTTQSASVSHPKGGSVSKTFTFNNIEHNADGTKTVSWSWSCATGTSVLGTITDSGTRVLTSLHKAPEINSFTAYEVNPTLIQADIPMNTIVENLSVRNVSISYSTYDSATISEAGIYKFPNFIAFPITELTQSNVKFLFDATSSNLQKVIINNVTKCELKPYIKDSLNGQTIADRLLYDYIAYTPVSITGSAKRNGQTTGYVKLTASGTYFNGQIGIEDHSGTYKPTLYYKYWEAGQSESQATIYQIPSSSITASNGTFSCEYQVSNIDYEKAYRFKIAVQDDLVSDNTMYFTGATTGELNIAVGEAIWTEYKDRVDFKKLTINKQPIIVIADYLKNVSSIASGSTANISYDITKTGYTPIAISGISSSVTAMNIYTMRIIDNTEAQVSVRNIGSATASNIGIRIYVAYIKE